MIFHSIYLLIQTNHDITIVVYTTNIQSHRKTSAIFIIKIDCVYYPTYNCHTHNIFQCSAITILGFKCRNSLIVLI